MPEEILKKLGPDGSLLYNMEELLGTLRGMEEDWITRQAVCDCMYALRYMDAFSLSGRETEADI